MKKIVLLLLLSASASSYAQTVCEDIESKNQMLDIGAVNNEGKVKMFDLNDKVIVWKEKEDMEQSDLLQSDAFLKTVFDNKLVFKGEGDEYWHATISRNTLQFSDLVLEKNLTVPITFNKKRFTKDMMFYTMFQSKDKSIFGLIREVSGGNCELCTCEETSVYEIFINYKGYVYKGCAIIDVAK